MRTGRRQFLTAGGLAAAGLACGGFGVRRGPRFAGGMAGPDADLGHRFRDGGFPAPTASSDCSVVVVGGGVAGLAAARELDRSGVRDWRLLELEAEPGGNASSGVGAAGEFPWGAHYVPLPGAEAPEVLQLFRELGVVVGQDAGGRPVYREEHLCHDPQERLFTAGRWQEGLVPHHGISLSERAAIDAFMARMNALRDTTGADGLPLFAVPLDRSSRDPAWRALDRETFAAWLDREGHVATELRWYVDYCCRDDFGMDARHVSAWAGLHYFASRRGLAANAPSNAVVTWPAGNGWLVGRMREGHAGRCTGRAAAFRVQEEGGGVEVWAWHAAEGRTVRHRARAVVLAVPQFVAARLLGEGPGGVRAGGTYAPWMVANVVLRRMPGGRGAPPAWDNVMRDSRSLGYVISTHQSLHPVPRATVLTCYQPLDDLPPAEARRAAQARGWESWCDQVVADLAPAHPGIADLVERIDVRVWGHGMVCPVPGWIWDGRREAAGRPRGRVHFAHSDLGGMSLFEEAYVRGVQAGRAAARAASGRAGA